MNQPTLNPMVFHQGFPHITEQIFEKMDNKSLKNCREVDKTFQKCIDNQNILWNKIAKKLGGNKTFQLACKNGHLKMAKMFIEKPKEFKIDPMVKNHYFYLASDNDNLEIVEMLMHKSTELNIDLNAEDKFGKTPLHITCQNGKIKIAEMLVQKSAEFNIDVNAKDKAGETIFHMACRINRTSIIEMILKNADSFRIDLTAKTNEGKTGYQLARLNCKCDCKRIVDLIEKKLQIINISK